MKTIYPAFPLSALAVALMTLYGPVWADDEEVDLALITKPESSVSVGLGNWSNERPQLGTFDAMRDNGSTIMLDADVVKRNDETGTWNTLEVRNLGLEAPSLRVEHERQGNYGISLEYNRIQRDTPYTVSTSLAGTGTTQVISGTGANALAPMRDLELQIQRDQLALGIAKTLMPGLNLNVTFKNEDKEGLRH